ncbi:TldD/PmbA family protein [Bradyrhizobium sp. U87765 SZCCT0131]|uniref:TldD/PmbA family protein n=1 Tax=unclassified Bradyrhizobium TaxID=2631580 RepID=UPI001BA9F683|nr:TldD/PmbA family protein [Bradyrhizobium sp. U87765 SZCCT0131]MBR1265526.1 TldD/PmbA family protein [Bradyrhizobium sp. U87765 SZCCT0134]MBR1304214.1 TldD/PmbA family protein [Bradyrhizobium sp. U87765 SZCCT0110]MBR1319819.1 TldD/PmbA family protein [Bradyrhizobium sp. U87765 SZCCT0109]MBR1348145.1 TldD/PmbA family protein [Bradyrhizobium sp. U87765 SZCCT0048]
MTSSASASSSSAATRAGSDLLDQSALSALAERLVEAAKRAGADAADAVAVRGMSQGVEVRDGRVEESERSEGDDVGLRVIVGKRQAVVSTNDVTGDAVAKLAERAVAMARVAPDDAYVGLADPALLARSFPDLDLLDPDMPTTVELERRALAAEEAGRAVAGVTKSGGASASCGIGGMVLVTSTGFHGAYLRSSQGISMTAIAGEGTGMERDYDYSSAIHGADLSAPAAIGASAGARAVARVNPRKVATCKAPVVFDPRVSNSLVGHVVGAANGASIARKTSFLKDSLGKQLFDENIRIVDDPLRVRGLRSQTFDAEGVAVKRLAIIDGGVLTSWLLDSATARELGLVTTGHAHRGVSSSPSPGAYNLHMEPGRLTPRELMADIKQGFYVTDLIGSGVNGVTGDYSRGAAGFWIENGEPTYAVSEVTIAGHLLEMFKSLTPANDLAFRYGVNAPTIRIEGLTIAGR